MAAKKEMQNLQNCTKAQYLEFLELTGRDNPILVRDENLDATLKAYRRINSILDNDEENLLSKDEKELLRRLVKHVYLQRKANSYLSCRFDAIVNSLNELFELTTTSDKEENCIYYTHAIRHSIKNEW